MKQKLSVTIDTETVGLMEERLQDGTYRNKSHLIELAVKRLFENE